LHFDFFAKLLREGCEFDTSYLSSSFDKVIPSLLTRVTTDQDSLLHLAGSHDRSKVAIAYLLKHAAATDTKNSSTFIPVECAIITGNYPGFMLLLAVYKESHSELPPVFMRLAIANGRKDIVAFLHEVEGVPFGESCLHNLVSCLNMHGNSVADIFDYLQADESHFVDLCPSRTPLQELLYLTLTPDVLLETVKLFATPLSGTHRPKTIVDIGYRYSSDLYFYLNFACPTRQAIIGRLPVLPPIIIASFYGHTEVALHLWQY